MQCPVDGETLVMTDRSGVEIDYCPKCRGVWLDRGELDKIIDRAGGSDEARPVVMAPPNAAPVAQQPAPQPVAHAAAAPDLQGNPAYGNDPADRQLWRDDDRRARDDEQRSRGRRYRDDDDDDDDDRYRSRRRRSSFLSELFDFD